MPQLGPAEILVILLVALLVFGPKRCPRSGARSVAGFRELQKFQDTSRASSRRRASRVRLAHVAPTARRSSRSRCCRRRTTSARRRRARADGRPRAAPGRRHPPRPAAAPPADVAPCRPPPRPAAGPAPHRRPTVASAAEPCAGRRLQPNRLTRPCPVPPQEASRDPDGRMPVIDHLGELRRRLLISIARGRRSRATVVFFFSPDHQLPGHGSTRTPRPRAAEHADLHRARRRVRHPAKVATYGGIVLALPVWLYELWRFITPGPEPEGEAVRDPVRARRRSCCSRSARVVAFLTLEPALKFLIEHRRLRRSSRCSPPTSTSRSSR